MTKEAQKITLDDLLSLTDENFKISITDKNGEPIMNGLVSYKGIKPYKNCIVDGINIYNDTLIIAIIDEWEK